MVPGLMNNRSFRALVESMAIGLVIYGVLVLVLGCTDPEPLRPETGRAAAVTAAGRLTHVDGDDEQSAPQPVPKPDPKCRHCKGTGKQFADGSASVPCPWCMPGISGVPPHGKAPKQAQPTPAEPPPVQAKIAWRKDYAAAKEEAQAAGKPLWVHLTMQDNCPACEAFARQVESNPKFIALVNELVVPFKVIREQGTNAAWCRSQGVRVFPYDLFYVHHDQPLHRYPMQLSRDLSVAREQMRRMIERSVVKPQPSAGLQTL